MVAPDSDKGYYEINGSGIKTSKETVQGNWHSSALCDTVIGTKDQCHWIETVQVNGHNSALCSQGDRYK